MLHLNVNLGKKGTTKKKKNKRTEKLVISRNIKVQVKILLQTNMDSISSGWDSTRPEEAPYFHCHHSKSERK